MASICNVYSCWFVSFTTTCWVYFGSWPCCWFKVHMHVISITFSKSLVKMKPKTLPEEWSLSYTELIEWASQWAVRCSVHIYSIFPKPFSLAHKVVSDIFACCYTGMLHLCHLLVWNFFQGERKLLTNIHKQRGPEHLVYLLILSLVLSTVSHALSCSIDICEINYFSQATKLVVTVGT